MSYFTDTPTKDKIATIEANGKLKLRKLKNLYLSIF